MGLLAVTVFDSFFCPPNAMSCRVMMVDDNDNDLLFTRLMLQRSGVDYEVLAYERAEQALRYLSDTPHHGVSLILLDINMPVMNGFAFLAAFEQLPPAQREGVRVLLLTSSSDPADQARAAQFDCVKGYLTKPLDKVTAAGLTRCLST
ncbi:two-component system response regulator [Hydrogenophaga sp.]|uniref:response regulator n=1 Tax=Hydrogenophaga sp. TaxID=1904254 RepID=UPI0039197472